MMAEQKLDAVFLTTDNSLESDWTKLIGSSALIFSSRVYYSGVMTRKALNEITRGITEVASLIATGLPMDVLACYDTCRQVA